jgi:23S rRNA (guanosine2251-2'-O)-methyltransferase
LLGSETEKVDLIDGQYDSSLVPMREWIVGRNPVYEVLRVERRHCFKLLIAQGVQEKGRLIDIIRLASNQKLIIEYVSRSRLESLGSGHQGVALETSGYPYVDLVDILNQADKCLEPALILILDTLQDPQNLGTLLRTAEVVGVHGVLLPYRHTAMVTPSVVHASSGASEHMFITQTNLAQTITKIKELGIWVIGLENRPEAELPDQVRLDGPLALVVGSEGEGMRQLVSKSCDVLMRLPLRGKIDSLNASVAGSIALYLVWQARKYTGIIQ